MEVVSNFFLCLSYCFGIVGTLLIYSILQERIMSGTYDGERFGTTVFLVLINRIVAVLFAVGMAISNGETLRLQSPVFRIAVVSWSTVYASASQYEALKYVSFPVQMLGKSFKMMPVMVWGMAIGGKSYKVVDWCVAAAVTGGVTEFLLTGSIDSQNNAGSPVIGLGLLAMFLACDGLTSISQERLFKEYRSSKYNHMFYVNLVACGVALNSLLLSGSVRPAITFMAEHPRCLGHALLISVSAVVGQWLIFSQVKDFGAEVCVGTMNIRQVVSVLASCAIYGHVLTLWQTVGLVVVFSALFIKSAQTVANALRTLGEKTPLMNKIFDV